MKKSACKREHEEGIRVSIGIKVRLINDFNLMPTACVVRRKA